MSFAGSCAAGGSRTSWFNTIFKVNFPDAKIVQFTGEFALKALADIFSLWHPEGRFKRCATKALRFKRCATEAVTEAAVAARVSPFLMFSLLGRDDLRRPRLWMLLWLLPYFVFSVWSTPLHGHTPAGREVPLSFVFGAPSSTRSALEAASKSSFHETKQIGHGSQTQSVGECFLCEWGAHVSAISVAVPFRRPILRAQIVVIDAPSSPHSFLSRISRNRGPPSSPLSL